MTDVQIRSLVRSAIRYRLESDLTGGKPLLKEVWEQCSDVEHVEAAKRELEEIIAWLREREEQLG